MQLSLEMPIRERGGKEGSDAGGDSQVLGNLMKRKTYKFRNDRTPTPGRVYADRNSQSSGDCLKRVLNTKLEN